MTLVLVDQTLLSSATPPQPSPAQQSIPCPADGIIQGGIQLTQASTQGLLVWAQGLNASICTDQHLVELNFCAAACTTTACI